MKTKDINIYSNGVVFCSVCVPSDAKRKDIEDGVNTINPTGITTDWEISKDNFNDGQANPHPCESDPSRLHYLLVC